MIDGEKVIAVIGSRKFENKDYFFDKMDELLEDGKYLSHNFVGISGGCQGVDSWYKSWFESRGLSSKCFIECLPRLKRREHYFYRNKIIAELADILIVFLDRNQGRSGCKNTMKHFRNKNDRNKLLLCFDEKGRYL